MTCRSLQNILIVNTW